MRFGLGVNANEPLHDIVKKSAAAETLGLQYLWISDSPVQLYAPVVASAVASATSRIRIGLGLMSALLHTPNQIASSLTALCDAYGNRFDLCIGVGDRRQLSRVGVHATNMQNLPLRILETKQGIVSRLHDANVRAKIWLGAQGPNMLAIANSFDGVLLNYSKPKMIGWAIKKAGLRRKPKLTIGIYSPSYVHLKPEPGGLQLAKVSSAVVALGAPSSILKEFALYQKLHKARRIADASPNVEAILADIPEEVVGAFSITMKAENLPAYLVELRRLGVNHVVFAYPQNHSLKTVRELGKALKPFVEK